MKRLKKAIPFIALAVAAVVIPVLATTLSNGGADTAQGAASSVNLDLVVLVNRMELTKDQMQALHDILVDIVNQRKTLGTALEEKKQAFETEMIAFGGTSEELDARLEAYRTEVRTLLESSRDGGTQAYEKLGDLLTYSQGMLLEQVLPRLDGSLVGDVPGMARIAGMGRNARLQGVTQGASENCGQPGSGPTSAAGMPLGFGRAPWASSTSQDPTQAGQATPQATAEPGQTPGGTQVAGRNGQGFAMRLLQRLGDRSEGGNGLQLVEELIRVLELKLGQA